jgi:hypothetical protein
VQIKYHRMSSWINLVSLLVFICFIHLLFGLRPPLLLSGWRQFLRMLKKREYF